jgi:hypothetical protein
MHTSRPRDLLGNLRYERRHFAMGVSNRFCLNRDSSRPLNALPDFTLNFKDDSVDIFKLQHTVEEHMSGDVKSLTGHSDFDVMYAPDGGYFFYS